MNLSELINKVANINILNDGDFDYLDYCESKLCRKVLTFIDNEKYIDSLTESISCVICNESIAKLLSPKYGILLSASPRIDFYLIHNYLSKNIYTYKRQKFKTTIGANCTISDKAVISPHNVIIGDNVKIEDFAVIKEDVQIGDNSIIRSGTIIGGEGFQFNKEGATFFIEHVGGVILGKYVELQYNTCVDKALFPWDNTIIGDNTKLDNLIHIGHAVKIGHNCLIVSNVLIGGSSTIGNNCWIGASATISNGLTIGNDASVKIGAVVTKNVPNGMSVSGNFAIEHSKFIKFIKSIS